MRSKNFALVFLEFGRGESFGVDERLLALVVGWRHGEVRLCDLDVVAEDRVVPHLERTDAGALALALFDSGDGLAARGRNRF